MSYTIFQNAKTAFQAIKTRSSNSRKTDIFPKGSTHGFNPKMEIFPTFLFQATQARKMSFTIFQNRRRKNVNFSTFLISCFYSLKSRFCVLQDRKRHFPALYCQKKKLDKLSFLDQEHGLTPLEKCQFFDLLNFLLFQPRKAFFRSRIS